MVVIEDQPIVFGWWMLLLGFVGRLCGGFQGQPIDGFLEVVIVFQG